MTQFSHSHASAAKDLQPKILASGSVAIDNFTEEFKKAQQHSKSGRHSIFDPTAP